TMSRVIRDHLVGDEFLRRHYQNVLNMFGMREGFGRAQIHQVTIAVLRNLKQSKSFTGANLLHTNSDVKSLAEIFAQLFSEFSRARGNQIDVLTHARLT